MSAPPLTQLLLKTKAACDHIRPLVAHLYQSITSSAEEKQCRSKLKADASFFTIADGLVQALLSDCLYGQGRFSSIVGEEDAEVNITQRPFTVDSLEVPPRLFSEIEEVRNAVLELGTAIDMAAYRDITVFIDPIDGTREFCHGQGEQCSILVGFARAGRPVAGLVYRPLSSPVTWAAGCAMEGCRLGSIDDTSPNARGFLTTNGSISGFTDALIAELDFERLRSGGCGNKLMMLMEGKGGCYIQDRGVSRWDTCAPQAVIESRGGVLVKLSSFIADSRLESYTYRQTDTNLDFESGLTHLTKYNARSTGALCAQDSAPLVTEVSEIKPYANVCGLLALTAKGVARVETFARAIKVAATAQGAHFT